MFIFGFVVGIVLGFGGGLALYLIKPSKFDKVAQKAKEEAEDLESKLRGD